jgi:hypothetical protein
MATPNPSERVARDTSGDAAKQMEGPTFSYVLGGPLETLAHQRCRSPNELVTIYVGPKKYHSPYTRKSHACTLPYSKPLSTATS